MEKISCVVIEDKRIDSEHLVDIISRSNLLELKGVFSNAIEAAEFVTSQSLQLILMDIEMPGSSGIEFYKKLKDPPECIFITAFDEHAVESWELFAFDFIIKPVSEKRFTRSIQKLHEYLQIRNKALHYDALIEADSIEVKEGYLTQTIPLSEVLYVEAYRDYCMLYQLNGKTEKYDKRIIVSENMKSFVTRLGDSNFKRIHRTYAVNVKKILSKSYKEITLRNGQVLPIGVTFRNIHF